MAFAIVSIPLRYADNENMDAIKLIEKQFQFLLGTLITPNAS